MLAEIASLEGLIALGLTVGAPLVGGLALVYGLVAESPGPPRHRRRGPGDGGSPRPQPPAAPPPGGGLPLPDATPSALRLRGEDAIADGYPRRERRPAHAPQREPVPPRISVGPEAGA
jgi:hypothetical protein